MTKAYSVRIPDNRKSAAERKARHLGLTFSEAVNAALDEWTGAPGFAAVREEAIRKAIHTRKLEAELAALRAQMAALASVPDATPAKTAPGGSNADHLIVALQAATPECPISREDLLAISGYADQSYVDKVMRHLEKLGMTGRPSWGFYYAVPGADIAAGVQEAMEELARRKKKYRHAAKAADGQEAPSPAEPQSAAPESRPAPGKPPAAHTEPQPPPPAAASPGVAVEVEQLRGEMKQMQDLMLRMAAGKYETPAQDRVARVREAIADKGLPQVITASELAATPAIPVFRAGPDVDCLHENLRDVKGVCPDCKQQVKRTA